MIPSARMPRSLRPSTTGKSITNTLSPIPQERKPSR
jgi:hypothetical protein